MKRIFEIFTLAICLVMSLTACSTEIGYTYSVDTGDSIEIKVNSSDGYNISSEAPFTVTKDDTEVFQGGFIAADTYDDAYEIFSTDPSVEMIDSGTKDGNDYFGYVSGDEVYYMEKVADSSTAILFENESGDQEVAAAAFDAISVSVSEN